MAKHDMNENSGFYQGPDGVFYDSKHDQIFELEYECSRVFRKGVGFVGEFYKYRTCQSKPMSMIALEGLDYCVRLGDL